MREIGLWVKTGILLTRFRLKRFSIKGNLDMKTRPHIAATTIAFCLSLGAMATHADYLGDLRKAARDLSREQRPPSTSPIAPPVTPTRLSLLKRDARETASRAELTQEEQRNQEMEWQARRKEIWNQLYSETQRQEAVRAQQKAAIARERILKQRERDLAESAHVNAQRRIEAERTSILFEQLDAQIEGNRINSEILYELQSQSTDKLLEDPQRTNSEKRLP